MKDPVHVTVAKAIRAAHPSLHAAGDWTGTPPIQEFEEPKETQARFRWSTGVEALDNLLGGFHGFCGLVGDTGCGKSNLAFRAAVIEATCKTMVYYVNGELDHDHMEDLYAKVWSTEGEALRLAVGFLEVIHVDHQWTLARIVDYISQHLAKTAPPDLQRVVIVLDTCDTIALWQGQGAYLSELSDLYLWCMAARKLVPHELSILAVAETKAKSTSAKGQRLERWSDLCISMKRSKRGGKGEVTFGTTKGRYTGDVHLGTFLHLHETAQFRLVDGDKALRLISDREEKDQATGEEPDAQGRIF